MKPKQHIMIDCESVSLKQNAALLSIAAVKFDRYHIHDTYSAYIDVDDCKNYNCDYSYHTLTWWIQQSKGAQTAWTESNRVKVHTMLGALQEFLNPKQIVSEPIVWANPVGADIAWLAHLYQQYYKNLDTHIPWEYYNVRCLITTLAAFGMKKGEVPVPFKGTLHDAEADAKHQIRIVQWLVANKGLIL